MCPNVQKSATLNAAYEGLWNRPLFLLLAVAVTEGVVEWIVIKT